MKLNTWAYVFSTTGRSIQRNGVMSLASSSTVALTLLVVALFALLSLNVGHMLSAIEGQIQLIAYLDEGTPRNQAPALLEQITRVSGVTGATFVTREEALDRLRAQFGDQADLLDAVQDMNPLRDEIDIDVPDPARVAAVASQVSALAQVVEVAYPAETVARLETFSQGLRTAGMVLAALMAVVTVFLISNTVRITVFARRREIGIMKLVGATDGLIRWPFLFEGAALGLVGAGLAAAITWFGYSWVYEQVKSAIPFLPMMPPQGIAGTLVGGLIAVGVLLGGAGSVLSVRRYLRV